MDYNEMIALMAAAIYAKIRPVNDEDQYIAMQKAIEKAKKLWDLTW